MTVEEGSSVSLCVTLLSEQAIGSEINVTLMSSNSGTIMPLVITGTALL